MHTELPWYTRGDREDHVLCVSLPQTYTSSRAIKWVEMENKQTEMWQVDWSLSGFFPCISPWWHVWVNFSRALILFQQLWALGTNKSPSPRLLLKVTPLETAQGESRDPVSAQSQSHVIIILFKEKLKSLFSSSKPTRCLIKTQPWEKLNHYRLRNLTFPTWLL